MNDNKSAADFKVSFTVINQDLHLTTSSLLLQPSMSAMNFMMLLRASTSRFTDDSFPNLIDLLFLCLTAIFCVFSVVQRDTICICLVYNKSRFLILLNNFVKLQPIGMWVRKEIGTLTFGVAEREGGRGGGGGLSHQKLSTPLLPPRDE